MRPPRIAARAAHGLVAQEAALGDDQGRAVVVHDGAAQAAAGRLPIGVEGCQAAHGLVRRERRRTDREAALVVDGAAVALVGAVGLIAEERAADEAQAGAGLVVDGAAEGVAIGVSEGFVARERTLVDDEAGTGLDQEAPPALAEPPVRVSPESVTAALPLMSNTRPAPPPLIVRLEAPRPSMSRLLFTTSSPARVMVWPLSFLENAMVSPFWAAAISRGATPARCRRDS